MGTAKLAVDDHVIFADSVELVLLYRPTLCVWYCVNFFVSMAQDCLHFEPYCKKLLGVRLKLMYKNGHCVFLSYV